MPGPLQNTEALRDLVQQLQALGTDHQRLEAKRARRDIPDGLWKAISAFSNTQGQGGGTILLGVDENNGFKVTGVEHVSVIQDKVRTVRQAMTPRPQLSVQAHSMDGRNVVEVFVPEIPDADKPCFKSAAGRLTGSYKRVGDSNERMNDAELRALDLVKMPARHDEQPVDGASVEDLDPDLVQRFIAERRRKDRAGRYTDMTDDGLLRHEYVLTPDGRATVAALIAMGHEPGHFHPGLRIQFVAWATDEVGGSDASGLRYVDNPPMFDGPLAKIFRRILGSVKSNLRTGSRIDTFRTDVPEYPDIALREALVNALAHRELHPGALNSHVTVSVFPSRIEIVNPGGLYQVGLDEDGRPAGRSTRNPRLMSILEDLPVSKDEGPLVENRGGGIPAIVREIRKAGLHQPRFVNQVSQFAVRFPRGSLIAQETLDWLAREAPRELTVSQRIGAAMLHQGDELTNETYRRATGVDSALATRELAGLVDKQLATPEGERGGRKYRLHPNHSSMAHGARDEPLDEPLESERPPVPRSQEARQAWILAEIDAGGGVRVVDVMDRFEVSKATATRDISGLLEAGTLKRVGGRRYGRYVRA